MAQALALRTTTQFPQPILDVQDMFGLTVADTQEALAIVTDFKTNAKALTDLLETGLSILQVREVFDARDRINMGLRTGQSAVQQSISLKQLAIFRAKFTSIPEDGESLAIKVMELHERFRDSYISHILSQLGTMAERYPQALPEALADLLEARLEFGNGEDLDTDED